MSMKKIKKFLCVCLTCALISSSSVVYAENTSNKVENTTIKTVGVSNENILTKDDLESVDINMASLNSGNLTGKNVKSKIKLSRSKSLSLAATTTATTSAAVTNDNTDVNYPELLTFGQAVTSTLDTENSIKWYSFSTTGNSVITADLQMNSTADFDIYIFQLDAATMTLNLVGGSASTTVGAEELAKLKVGSGKYYVAVSSTVGTGNFTTSVYCGRNDSFELNDSTESATPYVRGKEMNGTIDSPYDFDTYKVTLTKNENVDFKFTRPTNGDYELYLFDGSTFYTLPDMNTYGLAAGTYYFIVKSNGNTLSYNDSSSYGLTILDYDPAETVFNISVNANSTDVLTKITTSDGSRHNYVVSVDFLNSSNRIISWQSDTISSATEVYNRTFCKNYTANWVGASVNIYIDGNLSYATHVYK